MKYILTTLILLAGIAQAEPTEVQYSEKGETAAGTTEVGDCKECVLRNAKPSRTADTAAKNKCFGKDIETCKTAGTTEQTPTEGSK